MFVYDTAPVRTDSTDTSWLILWFRVERIPKYVQVSHGILVNWSVNIMYKQNITMIIKLD